MLRLHGDQFTEAGAIPLAIELGARSVDHLESTGAAGSRALAASDVVGVLLPASALFLGRPMPPARALVDAGAAIALATDFNPGSAFCESLPLVCSLACTQLRLGPEEALAACTVNAAHVLPRADRKGRLAVGFDADIVLLARTTGGISRTTSEARSCTRCSRGGRRSWSQPGIIAACRPANSVARRAKEHRHEYVWEDAEGNELEPRRGSRPESRSAADVLRPRGPGGAAAFVAAHAQARARLRSGHVRRDVSALERSHTQGADRPDRVHRGDLHSLQLLPRRRALALVQEAGGPARGRRDAGADDGTSMALVVEQLSLGPIGTNCYVVRADRTGPEAVVVDPSGDATSYVSGSRELGARCVAILVTHGHWDHLVGVAELADATGAPVHMAEGERALLEDPNRFTPSAG